MRLSRILAIVFVVGCGTAENTASPAEPAEVEDEPAEVEEVSLDDLVVPEPAPADEVDDVIGGEGIGVEAVEPEVVEPAVDSEATEIGHDAVHPAPRVHRRPRTGGARAPVSAPSRAPGGDAVYDIEE